MGLLQPHGRHRGCDEQASLTILSEPADSPAPPAQHFDDPSNFDDWVERRRSLAMTAFRNLDSAEVKGKRVLLRVDLNVPIENGRVTDTTRIERVAATILEIADKGGKAIILAHLGRPKGKPDLAFTLKPVADAVGAIIGRPVAFAADCIGEAAAKAIAAMKNGDVLVLENTRFHAAEEKNEPGFVAELAKLGDIYVNDAFSAAHRAHASTEGVARHLPAYAGRAMQMELDAL